MSNARQTLDTENTAVNKQAQPFPPGPPGEERASDNESHDNFFRLQM